MGMFTRPQTQADLPQNLVEPARRTFIVDPATEYAELHRGLKSPNGSASGQSAVGQLKSTVFRGHGSAAECNMRAHGLTRFAQLVRRRSATEQYAADFTMARDSPINLTQAFRF